MDKDIVDGFKEESKQILGELEQILSKLEDSPTDAKAEFPATLLADFSQRIDRIMGTVQTLLMEAPNHFGLKRIAQISELCKKLGYTASISKRKELIPIFSGFWADTVEVVAELVDAVEDDKASERIAKEFSSIVQGRLEWLAKKINASSKAAAAALAGKSEAPQAQDNDAEIDVASLLKDLDLGN